MKFAEKVLIVLTVLALVMLFNQYSGSTFMLMLSLSLLACIYFPLGFLFFSGIGLRQVFKSALKHVNAKTIITASVTGLGLSTICIGILFKFLYFPGANEMLVVGIPIAIISLIINFFLFFRSRSSVVTLSLSRVILILVPGIVLLFTSSFDLVSLRYRNHPEYVKAFREYIEHPSPETERRKNLEYMRMVLSPAEFEAHEKQMR